MFKHKSEKDSPCINLALVHIKENLFKLMDLELNHSEKNNELIQIKHQRKYEDRFNLNASNIIKGLWDHIDEEEKEAS